MMRKHYLHTFDPETRQPQRVAPLKSVAAVAVAAFFVVVGMVSLPVRNAPRSDSPPAGETVAVHAAGSAVVSTALEASPPGASPVASDEKHPSLRFDANAVDDYQPSVYY